MRITRKWIPVLAGLSVVVASSTVFSAQECNRFSVPASASENDLIDLALRSVVPAGGYQFKRHVSSVSFGYVVPRTAYPTGVLIVKSRHTVAGTPGAGVKNAIAVERSSYKSPCSRHDIAEYSSKPNGISVEKYRDYYFYGLPDEEANPHRNLDFAHADVGIRQFQDSWFFSRPREGCLDTRHRTIMPQFLYGDDRREATYLEVGQRQFSLFRQAVGPAQAYAAPPGYQEYESLKTMVIPYVRKALNMPACFAFNLPIPRNSEKTEIMVVDADEALANFGADPQRSWTLVWPSPVEPAYASIRR
jgi:hypothetical protein